MLLISINCDYLVPKLQLKTSVVTGQEIGLTVCSALLKQCTNEIVVRWVTTSEYPLLYALALLCYKAYEMNAVPIESIGPRTIAKICSLLFHFSPFDFFSFVIFLISFSVS